MPSMPKITIEKQLAEIGVRTTRSQLYIEHNHMRMNITTEKPQLEIQRKDATFTASRKRANAESGLKTPQLMSQDYRDKGRSAALKAIRTTINDGNFLGNMKIPGDRVGQLARNKKMAEIREKTHINIGLMPKSLPSVDWEKGQMSISWSNHSIAIDWEGEYMPTVTVAPRHSIEVYLRTKPYFRVLVTEGDATGGPGSLVDRAI